MAETRGSAEAGDDADDEDEYEDGDSSGYCGEGDPDDQERQHYLDVCWSFLDYKRDAVYDVQRLEDLLRAVDPKDAAICPTVKIGDRWLEQIKHRVDINNRFLQMLPNDEMCATDLGPNGQNVVSQIPDGHRVASRNSSKVRSTLRQFVRDWALEGQAERQASYGPLIDALMRYLPPPPPASAKGKAGYVGGKGAGYVGGKGAGYGGGKGGTRAPRVLCPGSGLARLPFELVARGYAAQGNEFSYHMLLGSQLILNRCAQPFCHVIYPFVLSAANRRRREDHLVPVRIPDVCPCQALSPYAELSMAAGEFVQVYGGQRAEWDAVASCFFLDTAKNIFLYIRTIAQIIRPGGYLVNLGPLLYHYAEMPNEVSIELSWEEVRHGLCKYFDIVEERRHVAQYTTNPWSLMGVKYHGIFFVARRNSTPVSGESKPVFS